MYSCEKYRVPIWKCTYKFSYLFKLKRIPIIHVKVHIVCSSICKQVVPSSHPSIIIKKCHAHHFVSPSSRQLITSSRWYADSQSILETDTSCYWNWSELNVWSVSQVVMYHFFSWNTHTCCDRSQHKSVLYIHQQKQLLLILYMRIYPGICCNLVKCFWTCSRPFTQFKIMEIDI